jgi:hypothetical protein
MQTIRSTEKKLSKEESTTFLELLRTRFLEHKHRHKGLVWEDVAKKLKAKSKKLWSLYMMETTGGEPDVVRFNKDTGEFVFVDCAEESPKGRRSLCFDEQARTSRKEHAPESSAVGMATEMGIKLLSEKDYRALQKLGVFDIKTSSWIETPAEIRTLGGALFCDRRYNTVFLYHNGAESYYASRGFRGSLSV